MPSSPQLRSIMISGFSKSSRNCIALRISRHPVVIPRPFAVFKPALLKYAPSTDSSAVIPSGTYVRSIFPCSRSTASACSNCQCWSTIPNTFPDAIFSKYCSYDCVKHSRSMIPLSYSPLSLR